MKKTFIIFCAAFICINIIYAQNKDVKFSGWKQAETKHFTFVFEESARETAEAYAEIADEAWNKISSIYSIPQDKIRVTITDRTNTVNAYTYFVPLEIGMFTTPCNISDFGFRTEWKKLFFTHELIHAANLSFESRSKTLSNLFGPFTNNLFFSITTPGWALEGLTTVLETELTEGGRGRSPYFELNYKAPTIDNSFISYNEIGEESEPPLGQSYVMGYLIMRSIVDRFGVQALSDIERNKSLTCNFEESIFKVTGETAENIYKDVKIALAKKYADERKIPEGKIISSRKNKNFNYKPAIILDDGSIISLRRTPGKNAAVIKLNPSKINGSNYYEDSKPEKDLNTELSETILFENFFPDENSVTADKNLTVYAVIQNSKRDKFPGTRIENELIKWTSEKGIQKLSKGDSYFNPSVSRDGSVLVALKQDGLYFSLYKIDTENGNETKLLSIPGCNILEPSLNDDGTKIAFLKVSDERAAVCSADLSDIENYSIIANGEGKIIDPIYPSWNSNGKLTFASNERGRIEVYEVSEDGINPVVSDPVGALWAYQTERGIYYYSYASNGYVIKMKPSYEWGNVPDFFGPSLPGEIISFGNLENDYPDYNPYPSVQERIAYNPENKVKLFDKEKSNKEPVPVKNIEIKYREEKFEKQIENLPPPEKTLNNEKRFFQIPDPILYFPIFNFINFNDKTYLGFGYGGGFFSPKLQLAYGIGIAGAMYYPELENFEFAYENFLLEGPLDIEIALTREFTPQKEKLFETNKLAFSGFFPFVQKTSFESNINFSFCLEQALSLSRDSNDIIPITSNIPFQFYAYTTAGLYFDFTNHLKKELFWNLKTYLNSYMVYSKDYFYIGTEGSLKAGYETKYGGFNAGIISRYFPLPEGNNFLLKSITYGGKSVDCSMPGRFLFSAETNFPSILLPDFSVYFSADKLLSLSRENQLLTENTTGLNLGYSFKTGLIELNLGMSTLLDTQGADLDNIQFVFGFKYGPFSY